MFGAVPGAFPQPTDTHYCVIDTMFPFDYPIAAAVEEGSDPADRHVLGVKQPAPQHDSRSRRNAVPTYTSRNREKKSPGHSCAPTRIGQGHSVGRISSARRPADRRLIVLLRLRRRLPPAVRRQLVRPSNSTALAWLAAPSLYSSASLNRSSPTAACGTPESTWPTHVCTGSRTAPKSSTGQPIPAVTPTT